MNEIDIQIRLARLTDEQKREMAEMLRTKQIKTVNEYLEMLEVRELEEKSEQEKDADIEALSGDLKEKILEKLDHLIEKTEIKIENQKVLTENQEIIDAKVSEKLTIDQERELPFLREIANIVSEMTDNEIAHAKVDVFRLEDGKIQVQYEFVCPICHSKLMLFANGTRVCAECGYRIEGEQDENEAEDEDAEE